MGVQKAFRPVIDGVYSQFDTLDGTHPWMKNVPEGYVPYQVRELRKGKILYFNFSLAKEMGLLPRNHPHKLNEQLTKKLIQTFSLQIINEYDEKNVAYWNPDTVKKNKYMATRYLQLQHKNKLGKTSGDGRGIWNGVIRNFGKIWDVSSRGTGVTKLSPGSAETDQFLKTGNNNVSYGCGQAELDELIASALQSEILHLQGITTERVLCVIGLDEQYGIGVRVGLNLIRPAHLFLFLKQNKWNELKSACDYLIKRQNMNEVWKINTNDPNQYLEMAKNIAHSFGKFAAQLDVDYIFAWLDWDGDNVLAEGGIIDYGSVRQFGIRHDKYRYDDVDRFSTNLNEQWKKAQHIVQVFVQIADYLITKEKKPIQYFARHPIVKEYLVTFKKERFHRQLYRMGFDKQQRNFLLNQTNFSKQLNSIKLLEEFNKEYSYFEKSKIKGKFQKVPDGINHPALFNLRPILVELPRYYLSHLFMDPDRFFKLILSKFARRHDTKIRLQHIRHIEKFQSLYQKILKTCLGSSSMDHLLESIALRAEKINRNDRITGNALIHLVDELLSESKKTPQQKIIQTLLDNLILNYIDYPEVKRGEFYERKPHLILFPDLYQKIMEIIHKHNEDI